MTPVMLETARVIAVHKDSYTIQAGQDELVAELLGRLIYMAASPLDLPTVGDWVSAQLYDQRQSAVIHEIKPRKSLLRRKTPGKKVDFQLIAANIDTAFIVQALDTNYNLRRLERYLVMVNEGRIAPMVLLSKSDLDTPGAIADKVSAIKDIMPELAVQTFSNESEADVQSIRKRLRSGHTYCLLGSSGVGKTTLLNNLIGESRFATKTVRPKDGKGRHSTTARQLIQLEGGALIIDTPGMRELGNFGVQSSLEETFSDVTALAQDCRFQDCTHTQPAGCAVLQAVAEGRLSEKRYRNFIRMHNEAAHNEMSYYEKRQKDRQRGKMIKSILKQKQNRR